MCHRSSKSSLAYCGYVGHLLSLRLRSVSSKIAGAKSSEVATYAWTLVRVVWMHGMQGPGLFGERSRAFVPTVDFPP